MTNRERAIDEILPLLGTSIDGQLVALWVENIEQPVLSFEHVVIASWVLERERAIRLEAELRKFMGLPATG